MCGIFGVRSVERDVARLTYFGLFALQHRGQESAGIAVWEGGRVTAVREMGLVPQVFDEEKLAALPGEVAIGHTRYSTTGGARWANAQPLVFHGAARTVALGHNGNLVDPGPLRDELARRRRPARLELRHRGDRGAALPRPGPLPEAVAATMRRLDGAYSVVAIADGALVAFRDPLGIRPLTLGQVGDDWVVASETCALDLVGADVVRDVSPGEVVWVDEDGCHSAQAVPAGRGAACIFEHVYFARPDSILDGTGVHAARVRMGERLAEEAPVEADLVMPIPDSGTPAAIGFAKRSGIPFEEGLIKNRYVGRTFIEPDQELRRQGIRLKFNPLAEIAGRRIVVVDDSIVRGNTMRALVQMLFGAAPPRCTSGSRRRRSSRRASTGSTWPTRTSSPPRTARSRRCASTSARRASPTSRSTGCSGRPGCRGVGLPRLLHAALPDARAGRAAGGEAPLRDGGGHSADRRRSPASPQPCAPSVAGVPSTTLCPSSTRETR